MFSVALHYPHTKFKGNMATTGFPPPSPGLSPSHCLYCILHLDEHDQYKHVHTAGLLISYDENLQPLQS